MFITNFFFFFFQGRCNREKPPCKYFHPPQHLKDQLLINGRNHLALKNALMQQMGIAPGQPVIPGQVQAVVCSLLNNLKKIVLLIIKIIIVSYPGNKSLFNWYTS